MASKIKRVMMGRKAGIVMFVIGAILLTLSVLWVTVFWPKMAMIPSSIDANSVTDGYLYTADPNNPGQFLTVPIHDKVHAYGNVTYDGCLIIHQQHDIWLADYSQITSQLHCVTAVDRKTGRINTGLTPMPVDCSGGTGGYLMAPMNMKDDTMFWLYHSETMSVQPTYYVRDETFHGVKAKVFIQVINDAKVQIPGFDGYVTGNITKWYDPKSGTELKNVSDECIYMNVPNVGKVTVSKSTMTTSEESIQDNLHTAHKINTFVPLMGKILPWTLFGIGALLAIAGVVIITKSGKQEQT